MGCFNHWSQWCLFLTCVFHLLLLDAGVPSPGAFSRSCGTPLSLGWPREALHQGPHQDHGAWGSLEARARQAQSLPTLLPLGSWPPPRSGSLAPRRAASFPGVQWVTSDPRIGPRNPLAHR